MFISIEKLLTTKIYYDADLVIRTSKGDNLVNVVFHDALQYEEFEELIKDLHFIPNTNANLYYPPKYFNLVSYQLLNKLTDRNEFYRELKERKFSKKYVKTLDMNVFKEKNKKVFVVNMSKAQTDLSDYLSKFRKTGENKYKAIEKFVSMYLKKDVPLTTGKKNIFIVVNNSSTPLVEFLQFGLKRHFVDVSKLFEGYNVIFINPFLKITYKVNLADANKNISTSNLLRKFLEFSTSSKLSKETLTTSQDVSVPDAEEFTPEEKETLPPQEDTKVSTEEDMPKFEKQKDVEDLNTIKIKEIEVSSKDVSDSNNYDALSDISFDEISSHGASNELEKTTRDNEEFISKMVKWQEKALVDFEEKSNTLSKDKTLDNIKVNDTSIINNHFKESSLNAITSSYYKKQYLKDLVSIVKSLNNDPEFPVIVSKFEITDNSNPLSLQDEVSVQFIDKKGKRHTFTVDVPRMTHDGFLYYNGSKKFIAKQTTLLPIIKEANDRVQITTNYRKSFVYRKGDKVNVTVDKVLRLLTSKDYPSIKKVYGNSKATNMEFNTSLPYNYLAQKFISIKFGKSLMLYCNQNAIREVLNTEKISVPDNYIPIAINYTPEKKIFSVTVEDINTRKIHIYSTNHKKIIQDISNSFTDYIRDTLLTLPEKEISADFKALASSKSLAYTEIKIASTSIALGVLIAFYKGLLGSLDLYKVKYTVEDKRRPLLNNEYVLPFKDQLVYMTSEGNTAKELFINSLLFLNTREYPLQDSQRLGTLYLEYFNEYTGSRNTAKALMNFESSMIDPITLEILKELKLPETFAELVLYANTMLSDYNRKRKNDMSNFRVRSAEVINVAFYQTLMTAFNNYKRTAKTGIVTPISPPSRQSVIKELSENPNIEGYSVLNPYYEIEMAAKSTYKGPSGLNSEDAYTAEMRAYDESMLGLYGYYTPVSAGVGIVRSLTANPKMTNTRGYLKDTFDVEKASQDELFSFGELVNGFVPRHADPMRICMATTQSKHIIPTKESHPYLIGTGAEKALAHVIGQDFAYKAMEDGVIDKIDVANKLIFIKYKDGTTSAIDTEEKPVFNQGSGFYTTNHLQIIEKFNKVGAKFKKGDVIAANDSFFKPMDGDNSFSFCPGRLSKVAIMCLDNTYEDSTAITEDLAHAMSSDIISAREIVLKKNSRVISFAKVGDIVNTNDPLIVFEEVGDNEKDALESLDKLSAIDSKAIQELSRSTAKAKYAGEIVSIEIHYNVDLDDLHPTLRTFVDAYIKKYDKKVKLLSGIRNDELITIPNTSKVDSTKILGNEMEGVLITYYIKHEEVMGIGNKITFFGSCKTIIGETIPAEKAPYSDYRKDEQIDAILTPMSIISRMVSDLFLMGYSNKVLLELKRQVFEDLDL